MAKKLVAKLSSKCIGCELCVFEVQRQLKIVGIQDSPIRIFRKKEEHSLLDEIIYEVHISERVNDLDLQKIVNSCPTGVFTIVDVDENEQKTKKLLE